MTTKTDEQEREAFKAWLTHHCDYDDLNKSEIELASDAWQARATLQSQDLEDTFCVWHNDPETDNSWDTSCRQLFEIYDGTPTENSMAFCCYCGKPIREAIDHACRIEGEAE